MYAGLSHLRMHFLCYASVGKYSLNYNISCMIKMQNMVCLHSQRYVWLFLWLICSLILQQPSMKWNVINNENGFFKNSPLNLVYFHSNMVVMHFYPIHHISGQFLDQFFAQGHCDKGKGFITHSRHIYHSEICYAEIFLLVIYS